MISLKLDNMKRRLIIFFAAILAGACSYMPEAVRHEVDIEIFLNEVKGNFIFGTITPSNDYVKYFFSVAKAGELDAVLAAGMERDFQVSRINEARNEYNEWLKWWPGRTDEYVVSMSQHLLISSKTTQYVTDLEPNTDYYAYAFCVDQSTYEPIGHIQKVAFRTIDVLPSTNLINLDFMPIDNNGTFNYYVRPSYGNKVCMDTYFSTLFKDSDYMAEPYGGDIRKYLEWWQDYYKAVLTAFVSYDISKYSTILELEEGEDYTIVGTPYGNPAANKITVRHFTYHKGMKTDYGHDYVIE